MRTQPHLLSQTSWSLDNEVSQYVTRSECVFGEFWWDHSITPWIKIM